jgi:alpha-1,3/alpha-1,6-mannosyltransferase
LPLFVFRVALLKKRRPDLSMFLTVAGGYDTRVAENVEHLEELMELALELGIYQQMTFLRSPSDAEKLSQLCLSSLLVYTPSGEHFGIVPVEAMYCGVPVLAVNNGGPKESVVDGETGFLRKANETEFSEVMEMIADGGQGRDSPIVKHYSSIKNPCFVTCVNYALCSYS